MTTKYVQAKFDYESEDPTILNLDVDEILKVIDESDATWLFGERPATGEKGYFPAEYVQFVDADGNPLPDQPNRGAQASAAMNTFEVADGAADQRGNASSQRTSLKESMSGMMGRKEMRQESRMEMEDALRNMIMQEEDAVSSKRGTRTTQDGGAGATGSAVPNGAPMGMTGMSGAGSGNMGAANAGTNREPLLADYKAMDATAKEKEDMATDEYASGGVYGGEPRKQYKLEELERGAGNYPMAQYARYLSMFAAFACAIIGISDLPFYYKSLTESSRIARGVGGISSVLLFFIERYFGLRMRSNYMMNLVLSIVFVGISVLYWVHWTSYAQAIMWNIASIISFVAWLIRDEIAIPKKRKKKASGPKTCGDRCTDFNLWVQSKTPASEFIGLALFYFTINGLLFYDVFRFYEFGYGMTRHQAWFANAKAFGWVVDLNAAIVLLPMCKTLLRTMYNKAESSRIFRFLVKFFSLDTAIRTHIMIAWVMLLAALGHTLSHYVFRYIGGPWPYMVYGPGVWYTGGALLLIMQVMYSASIKPIRREKFELFWYVHHLFIPYELLIIFHGGPHYGITNFGPHYIFFFIAPGLTYIAERLFREFRSKTQQGVVSVTHMNNPTARVYCLELEKVGPIAKFKEGQYVHLRCPAISMYQWHPFTISSAPQNDTTTIHIRSMGPGSWTDRFQNYLEILGPRGQAYYKLTHYDQKGNLVPQAMDPSGKQIVNVDGPNSAPTQHLGEYNAAMVVGAGIGVTPVRACLQSVVHHRFKYSTGSAMPDKAYFYWVVNWKQLEAFTFMIRSIKEAVDEFLDLTKKNPASMESKRLEIHIFVTSVPKDLAKPVSGRETLSAPPKGSDDTHVWGPRRVESEKMQGQKKMDITQYSYPFTELDIFDAAKNPGMGNRGGSGPSKLGPIYIHPGRPNWQERFEDVWNDSRGENVGVMYCGNSFIAKDLKRECARWSKQSTKFKLHKEHF